MRDSGQKNVRSQTQSNVTQLIIVWIGFLFVSLQLMVWPASAAVESVNPIPGTEISFYYADVWPGGTQRSTPEASCSAYTSSSLMDGHGIAGLYTFDHIVDYGAYGSNRKYGCFSRKISTGQVEGPIALIYPNTVGANLIMTI